MKKLNRVSIQIPIPLYERITRRAKKTGFDNESDYATYILREAILGVEEKEAKKGIVNNKEASKVFAKLKALGYI